MKYRPLGRTGLLVSEICFGTMTFSGGSGIWKAIGTVDQAGATALLERSIAAGVNFIDTANVYSEGNSERLLGQSIGISGWRGKASSSRPRCAAAWGRGRTRWGSRAAISWPRSRRA